MNELLSMLLSGQPLFISDSGLRRMVSEIFSADTPAPQVSSVSHNIRFVVEGLRSRIRSGGEALLTTSYDDPSVEAGSVALHIVKGIITSGSSWRFSCRQFEADLLAAEQNPSIGCHLLYIESPGGEAYYLDHVADTLQGLRKPIVGYALECCSAAYYIGCHCRRLYGATRFDTFGAVGTMVDFWDIEGYLTKEGFSHIVERATQSDLKNKISEDLRHGRPDDFRQRVLDPLNAQFLATVRSQRKQLANADEQSAVMRGEMYFTTEAASVGLCDGRKDFDDVLNECAMLAKNYMLRQKAYKTAAPAKLR